MNHRPAFTLTELLITLSTGSMLMILAVGLVHQSMTLTAVGRQQADEHRTMSRLADRFRQDVHRADQVTLDSPDTLRITAPQGDITYTIDEHTCRRTSGAVREGANAEPRVSAESVSTEIFTLRRGGQIRWERLDSPDRMTMVLQRAVPSPPVSTLTAGEPAATSGLPATQRGWPRPVALRIEAVVGANNLRTSSHPQDQTP